MEHKDFIEYAFQKLYERGWLTELIPSSITETEIAGFEQEYRIEFPVFFKLYLMAYRLLMTDIVGVVYDYEKKEIKIDTIDFYDLTDDIIDLSEALECFREEFEDCETPVREEIYKNLFPIGYMDGWYCLDLSQTDGNDCPVVFLEYGGYWDDCDPDEILHGKCAASSFRTFLEWYFCGSLESEYEKINHVTINHEFYSLWHDQHFISHHDTIYQPEWGGNRKQQPE